jgi:hypothetical protein
MITIDYILSPAQSTQQPIADLAILDQTTLRYHTLPGDIVFDANGQDFSARWGWVPVLDFDLSLQEINNELRDRDDAITTFEFTESDAVLNFARDGEHILISASYSPSVARVPLVEFTSAVQAFHHRLVRDIRTNFPRLLQNKQAREVLRITE